MKIIILLLFTCISFAQTNLSLTNNISLGHDCGNGQHETFAYQDVNLNGYTINLRNATLKVLGNLNGTGSITKCGNQNNSFVCVDGEIQNNPNLNGLTCQSLQVPEFELIHSNYGIMYSIFNLLDQKVSQGFTNEKILENLPNEVLILKVEGFKAKKLKL